MVTKCFHLLQQLEKKLDSVRREGGHNGERMQYLTGQLTSLQLEVGRTHGQAEHLRRQVQDFNEIKYRYRDVEM